jgi:thiol:disulfide interchange protein
MASVRRQLLALGLLTLLGLGCARASSGGEASREPEKRAPTSKSEEPAADDPSASIARALKSAKKLRRPVLVIFGADWCPDCRALDAAMKSPANADLIADEFVTVKVDVGHWDENLDVDARYGHPIGGGIPAAVVLSADGAVIYATKEGEP